MKKLLTMTVVACTLATGAVAQKTYGDELYEKGALTLNDIEGQLTHILLDNGVPIECLGKLDVSDMTQLQVILNDDNKNLGGKKQAAKVVLEKKCDL